MSPSWAVAVLFGIALTLGYLAQFVIADRLWAGLAAFLVVVGLAAMLAYHLLGLRYGKLLAMVEVSLLVSLAGVALGVRLPGRGPS